MSPRSCVVALCLVAMLAGAPAGAALPTVSVLPAAIAVDIARGAIATCRAQGYAVAAAIVGTDGALRVLIVDDGVKAIDATSARRKAETAAALDAATGDIAARAAASPGYAKVLAALAPDLLLIGGGLPIRTSGQMLGAIGVGGAPGGDRDEACARAAIAAAGQGLR